jgi:hypothetical protein
MSPAKETVSSPANGVPQNDESDRLSAADFAAILTTTLDMAAEAGLTVGVRATPANERRPRLTPPTRSFSFVLRAYIRMVRSH